MPMSSLDTTAFHQQPLPDHHMVFLAYHRRGKDGEEIFSYVCTYAGAKLLWRTFQVKRAALRLVICDKGSNKCLHSWVKL